MQLTSSSNRKQEDGQQSGAQSNYEKSETTAIHEERRIGMYLRAIEELGQSNMEHQELLYYIKNNIKSLFDILNYKNNAEIILNEQRINIEKEKKHKENLEKMYDALQKELY